MKRIMMVLTVTMIMVAMLLATAMPAFAKFHFITNSQSDCNNGRGNGHELDEQSFFDCDPDNSPHDNRIG
jgi:hypothetical protein